MISHLLFIGIIIACFYLGCLVYFSNPKRRDNRLFIVVIFWIICWLTVNYLENEQFSAAIKSMFLYIDFIFALILGYFWFLFCYSFLEERKIKGQMF